MDMTSSALGETGLPKDGSFKDVKVQFNRQGNNKM